MRIRYDFSSRRTGRIANIKKQRPKYPELAEKIINDSEIILEVLDARFPEETRNLESERKIQEKGKKLIYVLNKSDLITEKKLKESNHLYPSVAVSCSERKGIRRLRELIKIESKKVKAKKIERGQERVCVGVIGYPNTGKSSLINILVGKSVAPTAPEAGYTKSIQKLKLDENTFLFDSPGVIPKEEYSHTEKGKIAEHAKVGGRSYTRVSDPELVIARIMQDHPGVLEEFYKIESKGDVEILLEAVGRKKGIMKKGGQVNEDQTARFILKEWQAGKIKI